MKTIVKDLSKIKLLGRVKVVDDGLFITWPNSGLKFKTNATKVTLNFGERIDECQLGVCFKVFINGKEDKIHFINEENKKLEINLDGNANELMILRLTDPECIYKLDNIVLEGEEPILYELNETNKKKVLFLGDSLTTGFANLTDRYMMVYSPIYTDSTKGFAYLVSEMLGYENCTQSFAGKGIWFTFDGNDKAPNMMDLFTSYIPSDHSYNFNEFVPDLIVVNALTNDNNGWDDTKRTYEEYKVRIIELLDAIRSVYPFAKLVWQFDVVETKLAPFVKDVVNEYRKDKKDIYIFNATTLRMEEEYDEVGGWNHPNVKCDARLAIELYDFLKTII